MSHFGVLLQFSVLAVMGCLLAGCKMMDKSGGGASKADPKIVHCVFFTCKPGTPDSEIESLIADCRALKKIPETRRVQAGRRDIRFAREVNDLDYTVALVVEFDNKAGHDAYQEAPLHKEFATKHKEKWVKVRVFDLDVP